MKRILLPVFLLLAIGLCGCGESMAYEFQSLAKMPRGAPIQVTYDIQEGSGVRMQMSMRGTIATDGDVQMSMPMDMSITIEYVCQRVLMSGNRELSMSITDFQSGMPGMNGAMGDALFDLGGTVTIDKQGRVVDVNMGGMGSNEQITQMLQSPGFQQFVPFPPQGLRVGEAIDYTDLVSQEALTSMMGAGMPGIRPSIKGELVMKGTREVQGKRAAELDLNLVLNVSGSMSQMGQTLDLDMGMRVRGILSIDTETGMPIGTSNLRMQGRADMDAGGTDASMKMDLSMRIVSEPM